MAQVRLEQHNTPRHRQFKPFSNPNPLSLYAIPLIMPSPLACLLLRLTFLPVCLSVCPSFQYIVLSQLDSAEAPTSVNPMVLMREPGGWWGFHSGRNMPEFISSFSTSLVSQNEQQ